MTTALLKTKQLIVLVLGVLIFGGVASSYFWYPPTTVLVDGMLMLRGIPDDLKTATFVQAGEGRVREMKREGVFLLPHRAENDTRGISLSPDGSRFVVAVQPDKPNPAVGAINFEQWTVGLVSQSGEFTTLAKGYAPQFLTDSKIMYFSQAGIAVHDLSDNSSALIMRHQELGNDWLAGYVQFSPDRSLVLWKKAASQEYVLARISAQTYTPLGTFSGLKYPVLRDSAVYDTRVTEEGTEVWAYQLDGTQTQVSLIPASLKINNLLP